MKKRQGLTLVLVALATSAAIAQGAKAPSATEAAAAVEARKTLFKDMKTAYEPMTAILKRQREMDTALVATQAAKLQQLSRKITAHYTVDTRSFKNLETGALEGIWSSQADFKAKADALDKAAGNAAAAAQTGDKGATLKAIGEIGKSCGSCHDSFRTKT